MKNNSKKTNKQNTTRTRAQASGRRVSRRSKADRRRILFSKKHVKMETRRALYGTDHGASYALARGTDLNRRFVAAFLALVFAISTMVIGLNFVTRAEDPAQTPQVQHNFAPFGEDGDDGTHNGGLVLNKYLSLQDNGKYTLTLSAYAKGKTKINVKQIPTDYILVVDQSGSMAHVDMPTDYKPVATPEGGWKLSDFDGGKDTDGNSADKEYYYKDAEGYHRVYRKWGDLFEYVPRNTIYCVDLVNRRNLTWFARDKESEQPITSEYYYRPSSDQNVDINSPRNNNNLDGYVCSPIQPGGETDDNFYPLSISTRGKTLYYAIRFSYIDSVGEKHYLRWINNPTNTESNKDWETGNCLWYRDPSGNHFGPGDRYLGLFSYDGQAGINCNSLVVGWIDKEEDYDSFYTYGQITTGIQSGMFVQNPMFIRHRGYNTLAYRDFNGVENIISSTDYCDKQGNPTSDDHGTNPFRFDAPLYEADGTKKSRLESVKNALTAFAENVAKQADANGPVDHRIAIVGFSSDETTYNNTEIMTNEGFVASNDNGIAKRDANDTTYEKALISARANANGDVNTAITAAIQNLTARGGTQPEDGLDMAYSTLNNSTKKDEYSNQTRNTVVIFFTDGRPGQNSESNQYTEANEVVASAWDIKRDYPNTQIYTVGVFGEADGNPLTYFEDLTDWWGESTTRVFLEKQRLLEDAISLTGDNDGDFDSIGTYRDYQEYAENIYYPDFYKEEGTIESRLFTYNYDKNFWGNAKKHKSVLGYVHTISGTFWRECIRNAEGYPAQQNDTIADYMTVVSSSYPNATSFDGNWLNNTNRVYNTVVDGARGVADSKNYYKSASDPQVLSNIFTEIAEEASYAGTEVTIGTNAELRDTISDYFKITDATEPYYEIFMGSMDSLQQAVPTFSATSVDGQHTLNATQFDRNSKTINISGFDYTTNYIGYGKKVDGHPELDNTGYMLRVTIPNLELNDVTSAIKDGTTGQKYTEFPNEGSLYSNGNGAGIYQQNVDDPNVTDTIATFTSPYISRHSYTVKAESGSTASATFTIVDKNGTEIAPTALADVVIQKGDTRVPYSAAALENIAGSTVGTVVYLENLPAGAQVKSVVYPSANTGYDISGVTVTQEETLVTPTTGTTYLTPYADGDVLIEVTAEPNERPAVITMKTQGVQGAEGQPTPPDYSDGTKQFPIKITIGSDTADVPATLTRQTASGATTENITLKYDTTAGGYSKYVDSHGETHDLSLADGEKVELNTRVGNVLRVDETESAEYNTTVNNVSGLYGEIEVQNSSQANDNKLAIVNTLKENPVITGITDSDNHNWIIYILAALGCLVAIGAGIFLWKKKDEFVEE